MAEKIFRSAHEMQEFAAQFGSQLPAGSVVALVGPFGAGKTTFVQGLAAGLGIQEVVDSPSFLSVKRYEGRLPLYHMDAYRLQPEHAEREAYFEMLMGEGVCAVEWAHQIASWLPARAMWLYLTPGEAEEERKLHWERGYTQQ